MCRKFVLLGLLVTFLAFGTIAQAEEIFTDDFNTPHDYLVDIVIDTGWDGLIGLGEGETVDVLDANITNVNSPNAINTGALFIQSTGSNWDSFDPMGPVLYKEVIGDFTAIVQVRDFAGCWGSTRMLSNDSAIMARVPNPDDAGGGEDHVTMGYFPTWPTFYGRDVNDGGETEFGQVWEGCYDNDNEDGRETPWIQLERVGDDFHFYGGYGDSGSQTWTELTDSPRERTDMSGLILQVGLMNTTYSSETGYVAFDDFYLQVSDAFPPHPYAASPVPSDGSKDVSIYTAKLRWKAGDSVQDVNGHELYVSTDFNDVNDSNSAVKVVLSNNEYTMPGANLNPGTTYYWAVDEINDASKWEGQVWSFTTEGKAKDPDPYHTEGNIPVDIEELKWTQTPLAVTQNFYFGTDEDEVANSTTPIVSDIANDVNVVDISEIEEIQPLAPAVTYYWRIESVCGALGTSKGDVWSFLTAFPYHICDEFTENHDYFSGTEGTIWDGLIGEEYCIYINTYDPNDDVLNIASADSDWGWYTSQGVLLYKDVVGDFSARVFVSNFDGLYDAEQPEFETNNAGIMARVSDVDAAGDYEDWISMDYFPGWGCGNIVRNCDDGIRYEPGNEQTAWDGERWVQLERYDNKFVLSHSSDGVEYTQSPVSPIFREDMDGLPVQVGLHHAAFSSTEYYIEYDNFCLDRNPVEKAYAPSPVVGGMMDPMVGIMSWTKGDYAVLHNVWFSADFNDVNERKPAADRGTGNVVDLGDGRFGYDAGSYESLSIGGTCYWCIDEINDVCQWDGDVWRFEVQDYSLIDTFESYTDTGKTYGTTPPMGSLKKIWVDGNYESNPPTPGTNGSLIQLNTDTHDGDTDYEHYQPGNFAQSGSKSMKFYYDNDGDVCWENDIYDWAFPVCYEPSEDKYLSEAYAAIHDDAASGGHDSLDMDKDWSSYKVLKLSFYGEESNDEPAEQMYVGLEDSDGPLVTVPYDGPANDIYEPWWHDWYIALSEFEDGGVDLSDVAKIYIGFGDKDDPSAGNTGLVFFDDIQIYAAPQCVPDSMIGDFDDDCVVDNRDLELFAYNFPGETPTLPTPLIELLADDLDGDLDPGDDVTSWENTSTTGGGLGGTFTDVNTQDDDSPVFDKIQGKYCVTFVGDHNNALVWDQNAPATLTSDRNEPNDYTVIYEVYNPSISSEEWLFNWAVRGGPERTCAGVGYGNSGQYGCIIHWDAPGDMGFDAGVPAAGQWHVIAATYVYQGDPNMNAVVVDGLVHSVEEKDLIVRMDQPVTIGAPYQATSSEPNDADILKTYDMAYNLSFTGSVASIRVYAEAVPPGDLAIITATMAGLSKAEADLRPDTKIDFKDLAVIGQRWLQSEMLGDD